MDYLTPRSLSIITVLPVIPIVNVVDLVKVVHILIALWIIDLGTGLIASYFSWLKNAPKGKYFFSVSGSISGGFSSDKFKKSFVKGIIYAAFPLIVLKFQQTFLIKNISFKQITDSQVDITTICILIFCANEIFSIFWENLPKCGVNIPKTIKNLILGVKDISKEKE
jgi:phage-related holin